MAWRGKRGVTLVEFMIATLIFGITLASILGLYTQSARLGKQSEFAYHAYNIAKNRMERLRNVSYTLLADSAETDTRVDTDGNPDLNGQFVRSTIISNYTGNLKLTQVTVQVYYLMQNIKSAQPMELSTVIFQFS